jgi:hypothetical protein
MNTNGKCLAACTPDPADELDDALVLADDVAVLADEVSGRLARLPPGLRRPYLVQLVAARRALAALVRPLARQLALADPFTIEGAQR